MIYIPAPKKLYNLAQSDWWPINLLSLSRKRTRKMARQYRKKLYDNLRKASEVLGELLP